jgi:hypothetical protein
MLQVRLLLGAVTGQPVPHEIVGQAGHEGGLLRIRGTTMPTFHVFVVIHGPIRIGVHQFLNITPMKHSKREYLGIYRSDKGTCYDDVP